MSRWVYLLVISAIVAMSFATHDDMAGAISLIVKPYTFTNNTKAESAKVNSDFDTVYAGTNAAIGALNAAAGTKATLAGRLSVSLNDDGTFKNVSGVTVGGQWVNPGLIQTYSSVNKFYISGSDQTDIYVTYRRLKAILSASTVYSNVLSSVYSGGKTVVTLTDSVLTNPLTVVEHSILTPSTSADSAITSTRGALVTNSDGIPVSGYITWFSEQYDTDGIHESATNPSRLTVPAGATKVRVIAQVQTSGNSPVIISKNRAAVTPGCPRVAVTAANSYYILTSTVLSVNPGDYFEVTTSGNLVPDATGVSWFAMEIVE